MPAGPRTGQHEAVAETGRLVELARGGDRAALDDLFERHRGRLAAFVRARMSGALLRTVTPADLLQESFLEAARKLGSFEDRGPSSFYRWLVAIARFKILEAERARNANKRALERPLDGDPAGEGSSPSARAIRRERRDLLRAALAELPGEQGEAVRLRYLEGCTIAETSERLGRTDAAVKALVSRGLAALEEAARNLE